MIMSVLQSQKWSRNASISLALSNQSGVKAVLNSRLADRLAEPDRLQGGFPPGSEAMRRHRADRRRQDLGRRGAIYEGCRGTGRDPELPETHQGPVQGERRRVQPVDQDGKSADNCD